MKKTILSISILVFISTAFFAQIPNASFENWDTINQYCDAWYSLNDAVGATNTTREPISTSGSYSIGLQSITIPGFGIVPGLATTGVLNTTTYTIEGGYPTHERPDSLIGFVKEQNLAGDTSSVFISLVHHGAVSQQVGRGGIYFTSTTSGFRRFSFPITYTDTARVDTVLIIMSAGSLGSASAGSKVTIDQLSYYPVIVSALPALVEQKIDILQSGSTINIKNISNGATVQLFDTRGRILSQDEYNIDTRSLPNGVYFLQVLDPRFAPFSKKVAIYH